MTSASTRQLGRRSSRAASCCLASFLYRDEEYDEEDFDTDDDAQKWGCEFPDQCVMPGEHMLSECHTAEMMIRQEEAMNLNETKKKVEEIGRQYGINLPPETIREIFSLAGDLIAEVERLQQDRDGWKNVAEISKGITEVGNSRTEALLKQNMQQEQEIEELEAKVCGMREALETAVTEADGIDNGSCVVCRFHRIYDFKGNMGACSNQECPSHQWKQALSSATACPHKDEAEKLREQLAVSEAGGRLLKAVQEKTEAEVAALQAALDEAKLL